jgi:hypothetical protein
MGACLLRTGKAEKRQHVCRARDKRKWDNKGLAYAWYQTEPGGREKRVVIDDLKFGGADRVLERLLGAFKGELIEKVAEVDQEGVEATSESEVK